MRWTLLSLALVSTSALAGAKKDVIEATKTCVDLGAAADPAYVDCLSDDAKLSISMTVQGATQIVPMTKQEVVDGLADGAFDDVRGALTNIEAVKEGKNWRVSALQVYNSYCYSTPIDLLWTKEADGWRILEENAAMPAVTGCEGSVALSMSQYVGAVSPNLPILIEEGVALAYMSSLRERLMVMVAVTGASPDADYEAIANGFVCAIPDMANFNRAGARVDLTVVNTDGEVAGEGTVEPGTCPEPAPPAAEPAPEAPAAE